MRVLIVPYPDSFNVVGGHVTQQVETVAALERAGVSVRIGTPDEAFAGDYDIVHFFGDVRPLLQLGRPKGRLVVSPIYFPRWFYLGPHYRRPGYPYMIIKRMRRRAALVRHPRARYRRDRDFAAMVAALGDVDLIVVNSHAEAEFLRGDAGRLPPVRVAYSGVSQSAFRGDPAEGRRLLGLGNEPFVLSVARVEPRKNTVALALALRGLPCRFVHVGTVLPGNEPYLAAIRRANPNVLHIHYLDEIQHVYAAAAAHALPSWYETTGLATLQALAAGTPVAVADGLCEREYFGDVAAYCRPGSVKSVRRAVLRALEGPRGHEREVAERYPWDRTARELLEAYTH